MVENNPLELEEKRLLDTYNYLQTKFPGRFDSFLSVKTVAKHRNFWKPAKVKTMLLAESHVYTPDNEIINKMKYSETESFRGLPDEYVRLVYCLGYGEATLAPSVASNHGTPQYWKIFSACASDSEDIQFDLILKGKTNYVYQRLLNKVALLNKLLEKGIWLVDCSIVGLYDRGKTIRSDEMEPILKICWDSYISMVVEKANPGFIIVVGAGVLKHIRQRLRETGIEFDGIDQPQGIRTKIGISESYKKYQIICNR